METSTEKLLKHLLKHSSMTPGRESTGTDGAKYRYNNYGPKYKHASNWLVSLFSKAAIENGERKESKGFNYKNFSFYYDRPSFIGTNNGRIIFTELVEL